MLIHWAALLFYAIAPHSISCICSTTTLARRSAVVQRHRDGRLLRLLVDGVGGAERRRRRLLLRAEVGARPRLHLHQKARRQDRSGECAGHRHLRGPDCWPARASSFTRISNTRSALEEFDYVYRVFGSVRSTTSGAGLSKGGDIHQVLARKVVSSTGTLFRLVSFLVFCH